MKSVSINSADYVSMEEVHEELADALDFPKYYGKNLDALYDVLTDADETTIIGLDLNTVQSGTMLQALQRLVEVVQEASDVNPRIILTVTGLQ